MRSSSSKIAVPQELPDAQAEAEVILEAVPEEPVVELEDADDSPDTPVVPKDWHLSDSNSGIGLNAAYAMLKSRSPERTVVVAVIDSGVDIHHEDLDDVLWVNEDEIPGNGKDDDANGYVDDIHGWNFIGGADGRNVEYDTFEVVRELSRLQPKFDGVSASDVAANDAEEFAYYQELETAYEEEKTSMTSIAESIESAVQAMSFANGVLKVELGKDDFTLEEVQAISSEKPDVKQAQSILIYLDQVGISEQQLIDELETVQNRITYGLDLSYDPRSIVGDNYDDVREQYYGNNDVIGTDASHGTHVSGIIAGERNNDQGIDGIATSTRIMVVRAVPNGDERDKDVANAIRYAVDNGANIINMSFGKSYASHPEVVTEAIAYADDNNVLLVHAAGNDAKDNDVVAHYPNRNPSLVFGAPSNWLEVGASSSDAEQLAASFSNYGRADVDLFAPGVQILSTVPGDKYEPADGTSMAAPVVSGVAALVMAYFPELSASEVRRVLLDTSEKYGEQVVTRPGTEETIPFGELSSTGGVISAKNAVRYLTSKQ